MSTKKPKLDDAGVTVPSLPLGGTDATFPAVGYGLYQIPADESEAATLQAISIGYRHLDSASFYANEAGVGRAIKTCGVPRDELFVASKVWTDCMGVSIKSKVII